MKNTEHKSSADEKGQELVEAIYGTVLAPVDYPKTVSMLDGLLFGLGDPLVEIDHQTAPQVAGAHVEAVRKVQERIGRTRSVKDELQFIVNSLPGPAMLVTNSEQIVRANPAAVSRFGGTPDTLGSCIKDGAALKKIRAFMETSGQSGQDDDSLIGGTGFSSPASKERMSFIVKRLGQEFSGGVEGACFLLSVIDLGFNDQAVQLFRAAHHLTKAETEIAVLLAGGLRMNDIVAQRKVSADTVRTQIKTIKTKTSAADIPALVRLICAFSANMASPALANSAMSLAVNTSLPVKRMASVTLPDGRRMDYLEQGAAFGRPVLLFHNVPYGFELPAAAINQAFAENLRFIAPLRAGYGHSAILPDCYGDALVSQNADDHVALLDTLKIKKAVVISHSGGSHFALRLATRHSSRVTGLIAVGRVPIWRDQWMQSMPQQQRLVFRLTKYMPKMLPVVLWSMMACLDTSYATQFIRAGCKEGAADRTAAENQETVDLIVRTALAASRDTLEGFARECGISQLDLTDEARAAKHKFHILHGDGDVIVPLIQSQTFADEVRGTTLEIVENAGQLMFYSQWQKVMEAVRK